MNYPLISEYIEAVKTPEDNFDQLRNLRPVLDDVGEPVMSSGNFAVVFKMQDVQTGKLHALKCFLRDQEGRTEAYRQIAEELECVNSPFLTPIKYLNKELFVDSRNSEDSEFPVLLMDWVDGMTLDNYIRQRIDDQYELSLLAYQFSRLAMWLIPQPFAHGDLKPDNILVKNDGTLVLIDYDGMYVPTMKWQKARELGSPDFRHPTRNEHNFDERIDDFPITSILLSLKSISLQPTLLYEFGAKDRLLLCENDYRNLGQCKLLKKLFPSDNTELNIIYGLFLLAYSKVNITDNCIVSLTTFGENMFRRAQIICHGSQFDTIAKSLFSECELPIKPNKDRAYKLFKDLAVRGSEDAQSCLGCLLLNKKTEKDWKDALYWYREAAKRGNSRSLHQLKQKADNYFKGNEVEQNYIKAFSLYKVAADCGSEYGMMMLVFCLENGYGTPINNMLVKKWSEKITDSKYIYQLGQKYYDGKEVDVDYKKALFWFQKAALCGNESAIMMLGFCFENGLGTPKNTTNAQYWYDKIRNGNYAYLLGVKFFEGEFEVDYQRAVEWFNKAIEMGEASAYPYLAVCYSQGLGVDFKDKHLSEDLFNKATSSGFNNLIDFCLNQSQFELSCSLLRIWLSKLQEEHPEDFEDWSDYWYAEEYMEQLEKKGFYVNSSKGGHDNIALMKQKNTNHSTNSIKINFPFLLEKRGMNENEKKYGIVKDRWGNYLAGRYIINQKQFQFWGVKCGRNGICSHCYGQSFKQMIQTDYPIEITKEVYDSIFSSLTNCITEIVDILNVQPQKLRQKTVNSKFFIMCDNEIELCNIAHIFDGQTYYDGIHLSWKDYPDLLFQKTIYGVETIEEQYGSTFLESNVYETISQKIQDANKNVELMIEKEYNN